jgi:glycosyltransferase involved in cell wall biosynthesis
MKELAVLIPVYRDQARLNRSLESVKEAAGRFEVVIVDDGSPEPILAPPRLRSGVPVSVIRLQRNRGIAGALNHGLRYILGKGYPYIGRLDAGDTVVHERFKHQVRFLETHPSCGVVSSFVDFVDSNQTPLFQYRAPSHHKKISRRLHVNNCVMHPGSLLRASALEEIGLYREDMPGAEDYELFLRMARRHTLAVLPEVLTRCEYSPDGLSIAGRRRQQRTRLKLQLHYFDPACPYSFYGIACTLGVMILPRGLTLRLKRILRRRVPESSFRVPFLPDLY